MEGEAKVPEAILSNGNAIPLFGLGTWQAPAEELHSAVLSALKRGVRHIDCASKYLNEEAVGSAITSALSQLGLARSELFVTSKLWQTDMHRPSDALDESLHRLQLEYLDLWLIHWPCTDNTGPTIDPPLTEVWQGLERAYDEGKAKAIGVSNYSTVKLQETLSSARIVPHVNQVEVHVGFRNDRQFDFCSRHNIHVSAYSPLGSQVSVSKHPMEMDEVKTVAKQHNATVGQIMLAYVLAKGASVLPKTTKAERIEENLGALKIKLSSEDLKQLDGVKQVRTIPGRSWLKPETGPFRTLEDLWDGELDCDEC